MVVGALALTLIASGVVSGVLFFAHGSAGTTAAAPSAAVTAGEPSVAPSPTAGTGAEADTVTFAATGDIILGDAGSGQLPPNDGKAFFAEVRDALQADVVSANLESALTNDNRYVKCAKQGPTPQNCFAFRVPPTYASVLRDGGFTVINLANNHSYDYGADGYKQTVDALDGAGIRHTGAVAEITVIDVRGVKVAVLGFSPYGEYSNSVLNTDAAAALVKQAATLADLVVVQMHVGAEGADSTHLKPGPETFLGEPRGDAMKFAHAVVDAGADLVIGHGPHVMRAMEFYQGRLIAYSMGNFAGYKVVAASGVQGISGILKTTLHKDGSYASGSLVAAKLTDVGLPALDEQQHSAWGQLTSLCDTDLPATGVRIGADGSIAPH